MKIQLKIIGYDQKLKVRKNLKKYSNFSKISTFSESLIILESKLRRAKERVFNSIQSKRKPINHHRNYIGV